jgi:hypothetical protein
LVSENPSALKTVYGTPNEIFIYEAEKLDHKPVRIMINKC